jgi:hypothetical protein
LQTSKKGSLSGIGLHPPPARVRLIRRRVAQSPPRGATVVGEARRRAPGAAESVLSRVHAVDKVVCFFKSAQKFKTRYATLGFSDKADLDDGAMWPTDFALKELTPDVETRIAALVKKAVS